MRQLTFSLACFLFVAAFRLHAFALVGSDINFNLNGSAEAAVSSRNYFMLGGAGLHLGPVGYYHQPYAGFSEFIAGMGLQVGTLWLLALDAGYLQRTVFDLKGRGFGGALTIGYNLSNRWHVNCPIMYRRLTTGDLAKRYEINILPHIGVHFAL